MCDLKRHVGLHCLGWIRCVDAGRLLGRDWVVRAGDDGILDRAAACPGEKEVRSGSTWEGQAAGLGDDKGVGRGGDVPGVTPGRRDRVVGE